MGYVDTRAVVPEGARALLHAMCEHMTHRGPDSEGLMTAPGVALGMRRLAIIDLQTGEHRCGMKTAALRSF